MSNRPSIIKTIALLAVVFGIALSMSSCGTQKMGCPGSITQSEQPAQSNS